MATTDHPALVKSRTKLCCRISGLPNSSRLASARVAAPGRVRLLPGCLFHRHVPGNLYKHKFGPDLDSATNELVIRIQPKEAIYLKINNKVRHPGG